jgi:2-polyprenyl-3-methyl-5-hydroxy-6-metoxy-1,4-benzoquinol methylase
MVRPYARVDPRGAAVFGNWVNRHDLWRVLRVARSGRFRALATKLIGGSHTTRVVRQFDVTHARTSQWWDVPGIQRRWRQLITGDPELDRVDYLVAKHLGAATGLRALSPACGTGHRERRWARTGRFARIDGFDLTASCIEEARREAEAEGLGDVLHFEVRDVATLDAQGHPYDVIIAEHCLHHFAPISDVVRKLATLVRSDGFLFVDDFVGATRYQWPARQLEAVNALLHLIPERLRVEPDGRVKRHVHRPSRLSMILDDPSEAIESSGILPALREHFEVLEFSPYGGTLLQLVFCGIAHHFTGDDPEAARVLDVCGRAEDALLAAGDIPSDFVVAVCRPRVDARA